MGLYKRVFGEPITRYAIWVVKTKSREPVVWSAIAMNVALIGCIWSAWNAYLEAQFICRLSLFDSYKLECIFASVLEALLALVVGSFAVVIYLVLVQRWKSDHGNSLYWKATT